MDISFKTLKKYPHKVGINFCHIEFVTKYRYNMFGKFKQKNLVEAGIRKMAYNHRLKIHILKVLPDHVHMLVSLPRGMLDSKALMLLKGGSAHYFFKNHPKSRLRLPQGHLWSAGGCAVTVGYSEFTTTWNYIENQEQHHAIT